MRKLGFRFVSVCCALALLLTGYTALAAGTPYGPGDGNGDGRVNSSDARLALRIAARIHQATAEERKACDVNYNGTVTSYDARMILCVASRIYDMSYITPSTGYPTQITETTAASGREDSIPWDLIMSTATRPTEEKTTQPPPTHPNNYYTKHTEPSETAGETTTAPIPPEPGTAPAEPTTDGGPTRPSPSQTTAPQPTVTTTAPTLPPRSERTHFSLSLEREADGILAFTLSVKNAAGLKSGVLSVDFDFAVLAFVSAENNEEIGAVVNIRPAPTAGDIGCEFSFSEPLLADCFTFGTVRFRVIGADAESTCVGLSVRGASPYNWKTDGDFAPMPERCAYRANLNGEAPDVTDAAEPTSATSPVETTAEPTAPTETEPARVPGETETARLSLSLERPGDGTLVFTLAVKDAQALRSGMLNIDFDPGVLEFVSAEGSEENGASVNLRPAPAPGLVGCEFSFREPLCAEDFPLGTVTFRVIGDAANTTVAAAVQTPSSYNWRTEAEYVIVPERCSYYVLLK
ncbi:MAG: hypothetical protein IJL26_04140 [Clostridia bacterium]|nr:hypothetical protein [Clostridia bacterium]